MIKPQSSRVNWADHVRPYFEVNSANVVLLRSKTCFETPQAALTEAVTQLTGQPANPDRVRNGRKPGHEDRSHFLRKGQAQDWVNYFTPEAAEIFARCCGEMLIATGYESDHSWVQSFRQRFSHSPQSAPPRAV